MVKILKFKLSRNPDIWLRFRSWCLFEILKMKFDQDLCKNLQYELKKLLWKADFNPRVRCIFSKVFNKIHTYKIILILKMLKLIALKMIFPHLFLSNSSLGLLISNSPSTTKRLSFVNKTISLLTLLVTQWAAVTTHLAAIRVPPHVVWFLPIISIVQLVDNHLWEVGKNFPLNGPGPKHALELENYWKLDQVHCAWLIKWVVKREIIQLAELCLTRWWILSGSWCS